MSYSNLSFNNLREWTVDYAVELKSLHDLDVTGNKGWLPNTQLTKLENLHAIRGVAWTNHCGQCVLLRTELVTRLLQDTPSTCPYFRFLNLSDGWPWHENINYGQALDFVQLGFWPSCLCAPACFLHQYQLPLARAQSPIITGATFFLYVTGSVAIILNTAIVLLVAFHRPLRSNLAMLLICNVACCDVLTGLFSILYARFNHPRILTDAMSAALEGSFDETDADANLRLRNAMGAILTCAVTSHVWGGFLMTFEKFLKIVFVMKPYVRISKKIAAILMITSWSFATVFCILPIFNVGRMTYMSATMATPFPSDQFTNSSGSIELRMGAATGTQIFLIVVQLASLTLYLRCGQEIRGVVWSKKGGTHCKENRPSGFDQLHHIHHSRGVWCIPR